MTQTKILVTVLCGLDRQQGESRARNEAVNRMRATGADWLVMIDNDVIPPPNFLRLIGEADATGKRVVSLPTPFARAGGLWFNTGRIGDGKCSWMQKRRTGGSSVTLWAPAA